MSTGRKRTKADQRREQQRRLLFPEVRQDELWTPELNGWCWVPRTMPLILHAIRALSKGSSAAETYFSLWCHCVSESVVEMSNKASLIAAAGYTGSTSERTWKERMKKLEELGFIRIASGTHGDISCVLILNPHKVLRGLKDRATPGFDAKVYNCILEELANYGMLDFHETMDTPPRTGADGSSRPLPPVAPPAVPVSEAKRG